LLKVVTIKFFQTLIATANGLKCPIGGRTRRGNVRYSKDMGKR